MNRDIFKPPSALICHSKFGAKFKEFSHGLAALPKSNDKRTSTPPNGSYLEIVCANDSNGAPVSTGSYWSGPPIRGDE
jgi:hypothetical protein